MTNKKMEYFLLWAHYSDASGITLIGVYENQEDAKTAKAIIDSCQPAMAVKIDPIQFVPTRGGKK